MGDDFIRAVLYFFRSGNIFQSTYFTIVTRVPKIPKPSYMVDFRPISYCNVVYKCIAKILANKLKQCLLSLLVPTRVLLWKAKV